MSSVTITEVAALAGVSMKTVSRVLNAEPHVRDEVRERVLKAAQELRYRPRVSARSLAGSRAYVVAFLLTDLSAPYTSRAQLGALTACRRAGYHLLVETLDLSAPDLKTELETLFTTMAVDGVLLTPPLCDNAAILDSLDAAGAPYVRITPATDPGRSPHMEADDREASRRMTSHLIGLGHRRIGFVMGHRQHAASGRRLEGYRDALAAAGLAFDPDLVMEGDFSFTSGARAAQALLDRPKRPSAIFASNDMMALAVLAESQKRGLRTPEELSVAGFDDNPAASMVWPSLTTVRQPIEEMAAAATDILIAGASPAGRPSGDVQQILHCELVVRSSTAPVLAA